MQSGQKIGNRGGPGVDLGYYLDYAERSADVGIWGGQGAEVLGLAGPVARADMLAVGEGRSPTTGEVVVRVRQDRVPGWDFTFSAPKSVSLLYGIGSDGTRDVVRAAHDRAVGAAMGWLEREGGFARRGTDGRDGHVAAGLVWAGFVHGTSRAHDPQLHTHAIVLNLGYGADERWSAIDSRTLYAHRMAAGAVYRAELRAGLADLGGVWGPVDRRGLSELAGFDSGVLRSFSRRRQAIEDSLAERGTGGGRAAEAAALATRATKVEVEFADLRPEWRQRAEQLGVTVDAVDRVLAGPTPATPRPSLDDLAVELFGPSGLTKEASAFRRDDVVRAVAARLEQGARAGQVDAYADALLARAEVIPLLVAGEDGRPLTRTHRQAVGAGHVYLTPASPEGVPADALAEVRYSTVELVAKEQRLVDQAVTGRTARVAVVPARVVDAVIAERRGPDGTGGLSGEQESALRHLLTGGERIAAVIGTAGTGKTYLLGAARQAWAATGRPVVGVALAAEAAANLADGSGIPARSVDSFLTSGGLPRGGVLVVDEAGMVDTRRLAALADTAAAVDGKLVLVGDHRQLPAIEARGAFLSLVRRVGAAELHSNVRQVDPGEVRALVDLRAGRVAAAVGYYLREGRVTVAGDPDELRQAMIARWRTARDAGTEVVMLAYTREAAAILNGLARADRLAAGELGGPQSRLEASRTYRGLEARTISVGDEVICLHNGRLPGGERVTNGTRGTVIALRDDGRVDLVTGRGRVRLDPEYARDYLDLGYASTVHKAQGRTVGTPARTRTGAPDVPEARPGLALVYDADHLAGEAAYTALSRAADRTELFLLDRTEPAPETHGQPAAVAPAAALQRGWGRSDAGDTAVDELARRRHIRHLAATGRDELVGLRQQLARVVAAGGEDLAASAEQARRELGVAGAVIADLTNVETSERIAGRTSEANRAATDWTAATSDATTTQAELARIDRLRNVLEQAVAAGHGDIRYAHTALAAVDEALALQRRWQLTALAVDPPDHLRNLLGPLPHHPVGRARWWEAAGAIEDWRRTHPLPGTGGGSDTDRMAGGSPWVAAIDAEPAQITDPVRTRIARLVHDSRAASDTVPLAPESALLAAVEHPDPDDPTVGPLIRRLLGAGAAQAAAEALAQPPGPLVARLGPPPPAGQARVVWARTAAAAAAALNTTDLNPDHRRRLAHDLIADGRDELAALGTPLPAPPTPAPGRPQAAPSRPAVPDPGFTAPNPWDHGPDHGPRL